MIKSIPNFEGYFADKKGNIYSVRSGINGTNKIINKKNIKLLHNNCIGKYLSVNLSINNKQYSRYIHRIVLETFVGKCPKGMECCHGNGNPHNNNSSNLRWDTRKNNHKDMMKHGTSTKGITYNEGEKHPNSKLNEWQVRVIRRCLELGMYQREVVKIFNVSRSCINHIKNYNWKHINSGILK